jgi:hypothetical protein
MNLNEQQFPNKVSSYLYNYIEHKSCTVKKKIIKKFFLNMFEVCHQTFILINLVML